MQKEPVENEGAQSSPRLPVLLLKPTPRHVRLTAAGAAVVLVAIALVAGGMWAEAQLYRLAQISETHGESRRPPFAVLTVCGIGALALMLVVRRQSNLLAYGRPALATVRQVEKKKSDKGTYWRVHFEWTLLSGATRSGRYHHHRKQPPAVGAVIPIVYDRDRPQRHSKYPLPLVRL